MPSKSDLKNSNLEFFLKLAKKWKGGIPILKKMNNEKQNEGRIRELHEWTKSNIVEQEEQQHRAKGVEH